MGGREGLAQSREVREKVGWESTAGTRSFASEKLCWERGHRWGEARGQGQVCSVGLLELVGGRQGQLQENRPQGSFLPRTLFCFHAASGKQSNHGVNHLGARPAKSSGKVSRTAQSEGQWEIRTAPRHRAVRWGGGVPS